MIPLHGIRNDIKPHRNYVTVTHQQWYGLCKQKCSHLQSVMYVTYSLNSLTLSNHVFLRCSLCEIISVPAQLADMPTCQNGQFRCGWSEVVESHICSQICWWPLWPLSTMSPAHIWCTWCGNPRKFATIVRVCGLSCWWRDFCVGTSASSMSESWPWTNNFYLYHCICILSITSVPSLCHISDKSSDMM